jgi:hypothetical protein
MGAVAAAVAAAAAAAAASSSWALCRHPLRGGGGEEDEEGRDEAAPPSPPPSRVVIDLSAYGDGDDAAPAAQPRAGRLRGARDAGGDAGGLGRSGPYDQLLERVAVMTVQMERMRDEFDKMRTENAILLEGLVLAGEEMSDGGVDKAAPGDDPEGARFAHQPAGRFARRQETDSTGPY